MLISELYIQYKSEKLKPCQIIIKPFRASQVELPWTFGPQNAARERELPCLWGNISVFRTERECFSSIPHDLNMWLFITTEMTWGNADIAIASGSLHSDWHHILLYMSVADVWCKDYPLSVNFSITLGCQRTPQPWRRARVPQEAPPPSREPPPHRDQLCQLNWPWKVQSRFCCSSSWRNLRTYLFEMWQAWTTQVWDGLKTIYSLKRKNDNCRGGAWWGV